MSPSEAKAIIEALANGIDPETGEVFAEQGTLNRPQVIRALFIAAKALDLAAKRKQRALDLPGNTGRRWSEQEDQQLLEFFDSRIPVKEIANRLSRTRGAIAARLVRLGRIEERKDAV